MAATENLFYKTRTKGHAHVKTITVQHKESLSESDKSESSSDSENSQDIEEEKNAKQKLEELKAQLYRRYSWLNVNRFGDVTAEKWLTANRHRFVSFRPKKWFVGAHGEIVMWITYSKSGRLLATCGQDQTACIWNLRSSNRLFKRLEPHSAVCSVCVFSPDETMLAVASGDSISIWHCESALLRHQIFGAHSTRSVITGLDWSPTGLLIITSGTDGKLRVWNVPRALKNGKTSDPSTVGVLVQTLSDSTPHETQHHYATTGDVELSDIEDEPQVQNNNLHEQGVLRYPNGHEGHVVKAVFDHEGNRMISVGRDKLVKQWTLVKVFELQQTTKFVHFMDHVGHTSAVMGIAWCQDDSRFATCGSDGAVLVWHPKHSAPVLHLHGHRDAVYGIAFCPQSTLMKGRLATCGHDYHVRFWDYRGGGSGIEDLPVPNRKPKCSNKAPVQGWLMCVAFDPNGIEIATSSTDRKASVLIWERYSPVHQALDQVKSFCMSILGISASKIAPEQWKIREREWQKERQAQDR